MERGTVHTWLEVEHTAMKVTDSIFERVDHSFEIKLVSDKIVFSLDFTPAPAERKRMGDRVWFEVKLFGAINVGIDVARPGSSRRVLASERPWSDRTDAQLLEDTVWEAEDALGRLGELLRRKPGSHEIEFVSP